MDVRAGAIHVPGPGIRSIYKIYISIINIIIIYPRTCGQVRFTFLGPAAAAAAAEPGRGEAGVALHLDMEPEEVGADPKAFQVRLSP